MNLSRLHKMSELAHMNLFHATEVTWGRNSLLCPISWYEYVLSLRNLRLPTCLRTKCIDIDHKLHWDTYWRIVHFSQCLKILLSAIECQMKLNRTSARLPHSARKCGRGEHAQLNQGSQQAPRRDGTFSSRGNVVQDVWEVTQRKVKLMKAGTAQRQRDQRDTLVDDRNCDIKEPGTSASKRSRSRRDFAGDGKNQFQIVMDEVKARSKARIISKELANESKGGSPTTIQTPDSFPRPDIDGNREEHDNWAPDEERIAGCSGGVSPPSGKNWLAKTAMFPKALLNVGQRRSFQLRRDLPQAVQSKQGVKPRNDNGQTGNLHNQSTSNRRLFRFGADQNAIPRKGGRLGFQFKRKDDMVSIMKSKSIGVLAFRSDSLFNDEYSFHVEDRDSDNVQLDAQVQDLVVSLSRCQRMLDRVREEASKNRAELRSEVDRLNQIISTFSSTQEIRYRGLLDSLNDNARTLGHVESSFDHFSSLLNRLTRSTAQAQLMKVTFFLVNVINWPLLRVIHGIGRVYSGIHGFRWSPFSSKATNT